MRSVYMVFYDTCTESKSISFPTPFSWRPTLIPNQETVRWQRFRVHLNNLDAPLWYVWLREMKLMGEGGELVTCYML